MLTLHRVLVPTDFSESAEVAVRQAELGAAKHGGQVHVLHVTSARGTSAAAESGSNSPVLPTRTHEPQEQPSPGVSRRDNAPRTIHVVREDESAVDGILAYAEEHDVDLIVMGAHGRRGVRAALLGTTTERVVRLARRPVLTVRAGSEAMPRTSFSRILVPLDFSEASRSLIAHARGIAELWQASLDVLYVVEDPRFPSFFRVDEHRRSVPVLLRRAREALQAFAESTEGPDVPMYYHAVTGNPASSIVEFAEAQHADVVLLGAHGWTSLKWFTIGSVAEAVMRTAPCPVLSIKGYGKSLIEQAAADAEPVATIVVPKPSHGFSTVRRPSV